MPYTTNGKNLMLDALGGSAGFVSLHTANPTDSGGSEVSGGDYARQSITWSSAAAGNLDSSSQPVFDVPGGTTVSHFGVWSAASGGTLYGYNPLSASETFTEAGTYTLTDVDMDLNAA